MANKILILDRSDELLVSRDGEVYTPDGLLKHQYPLGGYMGVKYRQVRYTTHRLVAKRYIPNPENKSDVNHKDGNKKNNHVDNLEWMTRSENLYHALRNGLHAEEELPVRGTHKETGEVVEFISTAEAGRNTPALQPNIFKCIIGERSSAGGYYWERLVA